MSKNDVKQIATALKVPESSILKQLEYEHQREKALKKLFESRK